MKKIKKLFAAMFCLTLILLIIDYSNVKAQPSAPGFEVQSYSNVTGPVSLSFAPSGTLYAGNDGPPSKIYKVESGGSPVRLYGDMALSDPDAVVFDSAGIISGQPGSVLVGGIDGPNSPTGYLAAILPDESTTTIFGPASGLVNPTDMLFDSGGRLLIADAFAAKVFYSDDGLTLNALIGDVYLAGELAIDENGDIYVSQHKGPICKYSSDGTVLDGKFVTGFDIHGMDFGPSSPPWDGHLFAVSWEGKLYRIDQVGTVTEIGTGFHNPPGDPDLEFGPDGAMYVSDTGNDVIYRIVPKEISLVNDLVIFQPDPSTYSFKYDTTGCPNSFVGKFSFDATLTNISDKWLTNLTVECVKLTNKNLLLTDHGLLGVDEWFPIARTDDYADGILSPQEYVDVPFTVCCKRRRPFRLFVNIFGLSNDDEPVNFLSNSSFEEGIYSPAEAPNDWTWNAWLPTATPTWDDTHARTGEKSVKIYAPTPNDARWIQTVDVEPNTLYFLSGWIKTNEVDQTTQFENAGANLSLHGTWTHSAGVFGTQDWTRNSILFNSGSDNQVTVGARLGYWSGTTTGTAWFDDLKLEPIVPMDPHPSWKILVLIYQETDFEVTDDNGTYHHYVASMTQDEMRQAALAAKQFAEIDIPALTSGNMAPKITVRFPERLLLRHDRNR